MPSTSAASIWPTDGASAWRSHWRGDGAEARFLKAVHGRACRYFRVVLGPDYNEAHRDHFHLDRGTLHALPVTKEDPVRACV